MFDSIIILNGFSKSKKSVSLQGEKKSKNKVKLFYQKLKLSIAKTKPAIKFLRINITINSILKLMMNIFILCNCPNSGILFL
jgi:hypothetical protein